MIITVKTLQQKVFKIEIDDSKTVSDLKEKIEETQGSSFPAGSLKLIYSGKVLDNDKLISEYNVQEANFMVVMVTKAKKPPTTSSSAVPEASRSSAQTSTSHTDGNAQESNPQQPSVSITTTASSATTPTPASTTPATTVTTPSSGSEVQSSAASSAPTTTRPATETGGEASGGDAISQANTTLVTGAEYEAAVARIVDMGFDRSEVEAALSKSFNNPDRAVEYLFSGGPLEEESVVAAPAPQGEGGESPMDVPQPPQQQQQQQSPSQPGSGSRDWLQHPALGQLIQLIRRDPTQLQAVIQQFSQTNPDLVRAISLNPEEFLHAVQTVGLVPGAGGAVPQGGPGLIPGGPPGGARGTTIQVTPEEKEAIDRLKSMGFSEAMAIQAYFACDKNEELAANFLLSDNDFNNS